MWSEELAKIGEKGGIDVYSQPGSGAVGLIPAAATGITTAGMGYDVLTVLFIFCAVFALIGAACALKRALPVPEFVRSAKIRKRNELLRKRKR